MRCERDCKAAIIIRAARFDQQDGGIRPRREPRREDTPGGASADDDCGSDARLCLRTVVILVQDRGTALRSRVREPPRHRRSDHGARDYKAGHECKFRGK